MFRFCYFETSDLLRNYFLGCLKVSLAPPPASTRRVRIHCVFQWFLAGPTLNGPVAPGAGGPQKRLEPTFLTSLFVRLSGEAAQIPLRITMDSDLPLISPPSEIAMLLFERRRIFLSTTF